MSHLFRTKTDTFPSGLIKADESCTLRLGELTILLTPACMDLEKMPDVIIRIGVNDLTGFRVTVNQREKKIVNVIRSAG